MVTRYIAGFVIIALPASKKLYVFVKVCEEEKVAALSMAQTDWKAGARLELNGAGRRGSVFQLSQ